jgi:hypothetical protein
METQQENVVEAAKEQPEPETQLDSNIWAEEDVKKSEKALMGPQDAPAKAGIPSVPDAEEKDVARVRSPTCSKQNKMK